MSNVDKGPLKKRLAERIKAGQILNVIQDCALGKKDMTVTQLNAARICLGKVLPDLKAIDMSLEGEVNLITRIERTVVHPDITDS